MTRAPLKQRLTFYVLLGLGTILAVLVGRSVLRVENPNPTPVATIGTTGLVEVVLTQNDANQYVTTGRINGEPVQFLVDTGSSEVAMSYQLARRLGLQLRSGGLNITGNGTVQSWSAVLESVDIGGLVAHQVKATVLPNMQGDEALLGMAYLEHLELHLAGGRMTLRPFVSR